MDTIFTQLIVVWNKSFVWFIAFLVSACRQYKTFINYVKIKNDESHRQDSHLQSWITKEFYACQPKKPGD